MIGGTAVDPDKPALIMADGSGVLSFGELDRRSVQLARRLRRSGLQPGDRVALLMENGLDFMVAAWAARRSELRCVPVNWHLTASEAGYVVDNSDSLVLVATEGLADLAGEIADSMPGLKLRLTSGAARPGWESLDDIYSSEDPTPRPGEREGGIMPYSSGTTGPPKGILRPLSGQPFPSPTSLELLLRDEYGFDSSSVYLSPAPLYHAAPINWVMAVNFWGGTAIVLPTFDADQALRAIDQYRVTHAQFVPTHLFRMLRLPDRTKGRFDLSSLRVLVHAAAPCPRHVKEATVAWFGPIVHEYYAGSERVGFTALRPGEWESHAGSVGRSLTGRIHILDEETGEEFPPGEVGLIWFENAHPYVYHRLPGGEGQGVDSRGWGTLGDMGWVDGEGFLYLADRASHMIISGGVNIYPREIEDLLSSHPGVADVAVIGVPHPEYGEEVKAVVQPRDPGACAEALAAELLALCRSRLAAFKCPRSVEFVEALPRLPTGKLLKRRLRGKYWNDDRVMV